MSEEKQLWIRGLPQEDRDFLEREAEENNRSLSGQVVWVLRQYVKARIEQSNLYVARMVEEEA